MIKTLDISGGTLAYRFDGPAAAPVLLLANSLAADLHMWDANLPALTRRLRILRYDMRGHGASSVPLQLELTPALLANDVVEMLDQLGIGQVHFVGISLGGIVGQQLGARHPSRLLSLCLCNTMCVQAAPEAWKQRIAAVRDGGLQSVVEGTLERWVTTDFAALHPEQVATMRAMILRTSQKGFAACAAAVRDLQQADLLERIRVPTLILTGDLDLAAPPAVAQRMHGQIAGSRLHIIPQCAHLSNINQVQAFDTAVLNFIASQE